MHIIRGLHNLKNPLPQRTVVTLGNFDGVHRGHQALLDQLMVCKQERKGHASVVVVFEPQPREFFDSLYQGRSRVPRIMRFIEKFWALKNRHVDYLCCLYFDKDLAVLDPVEFVEQILVKKLQMAAIVVGHDFHFGAGRRGDFQLLQSLGKQYDFSAQQILPIWVGTEVVSSTRLRDALAAGDMYSVYMLLGQYYSLHGKVCYGNQRGRHLGFPTANINLHRTLLPISGVFVVQVRLGHALLGGVANIGVRPTFEGSSERVLLEVHLFDFDEVIYGAHVEVFFLHKLREEKRFAHFENLVAQIRLDVEQARRFWDIARNQYCALDDKRKI